MAFQLKDFASLSASMLNWLRSTQTKITDFNTGSVARTMLESTAIEMEELYLRMFIGLREAIPVSVYNTFGFDKLPAVKASVTLRFTAPAPAASAITVPAGSGARVPGGNITYLTTTSGTIAIGQTYVDVLAAADTAGTVGNTTSAVITELVGSLAGISSVTNPAPVVNGRDEETDDERLTRFRSYVSSLARGTVSAVLYGVKTSALKDSLGQAYEYAALASLEEPWLANPALPIGLVNVYIHNGAGGASVDLVAQAQRVVDGYYLPDGTAVPGWKSAGVKVVVAAAANINVDITGTISVDPTYQSAAVISDAKAAIRLYIQKLNVGVPVLKAELLAIVKRDVPGVTNVHLTTPGDDVAITIAQKALPGTITLTAV